MHISWHIKLYGSGWNIFHIPRIKNFTGLNLGRWIYHLLDSCLLYCIILIALWWRHSNRVSKTWLYKPEIWAQVVFTMPFDSILSPNSIYLPVITKESTIRGDITDLKQELRTRSQSSSCTFSLKKGGKFYFRWRQNFESWNEMCNNLHFLNTRFLKEEEVTRCSLKHFVFHSSLQGNQVIGITQDMNIPDTPGNMDTPTAIIAPTRTPIITHTNTYPYQLRHSLLPIRLCMSKVRLWSHIRPNNPTPTLTTTPITTSIPITTHVTTGTTAVTPTGMLFPLRLRLRKRIARRRRTGAKKRRTTKRAK